MEPLFQSMLYNDALLAGKNSGLNTNITSTTSPTACE